ncbi:MAG: apolipoprotein N-acyltransferase [Candidatus Nitrospinota bacterium M3_3B_026]
MKLFRAPSRWLPNGVSRRDAGLAALSGISLAAAFPDIGLWPLAWFGLVPFFSAMRGKDRLSCAVLGVVTGFAFFTLTLYWVSNTMIVYAGMPILAAAVVTGLMTFALALYIGLFGYLFGMVSRGVSADAALSAAPFLWVAVEFFRSNVPVLGFPWVRLADSQYEILPVIQAADIAGEEGLGFVIVLSNAAAAQVVDWLIRKRAGAPARFPAAQAGLALALAAAVLAYGHWRLAHVSGEGEPVRVALIQGNIDQARKWDPSYMDEQLDIYMTRTREAAAAGAEVVIWPETAAPFYFGQDSTRDSVMLGLARSAGVPVIFGAPAFKRDDGDVKSYNRAWIVRPDGLAEKYDKVRLVPFGEYVPFKKALFFVERMVTAIGELEPGERVSLLHVGDYAVGAQICFEIIFPEYSREIARLGGAAVVNITNDSWYGRTAASRQSLAMGVFRAVENRIPVLRAAQSGISAIVEPTGKITAETGLFVETTLMGSFTQRSGPLTIYTRTGDLFAWMLVAASAVFVAAARRGTP